MKRGFHRSDFTGSEGPGLARLRAANVVAEGKPRPTLGKSALANVRHLIAMGDWRAAILTAAKFPDLGDEAAAIHRGREALLRPSFQRQLKRDPTQMIEEAKVALVRRYGNA